MTSVRPRYIVGTVISRDPATGRSVAAAWDTMRGRAVAVKQSPAAAREIANLRRARDSECDPALVQRLERDALVHPSDVRGGHPLHRGVVLELLGSRPDRPVCRTDDDLALLVPYLRAVSELHRKSGLAHGSLRFGSFLAPLPSVGAADGDADAGAVVLTGLSGAAPGAPEEDSAAVAGMVEEAYGGRLGEAPFAAAAARALREGRTTPARLLGLLA